MEFRKIIAFGKSSFVVSLPKEWLSFNKLGKGDLVYLEDTGEKLTIRGSEKGDEKEPTRVIVNTEGKDLERLRREISSAFLNDNVFITITGKNLSKFTSEIVKFIHNFIAVEIIEQSSDKIVARDFLKVSDIDVSEYLRKSDIIVRSMFKDLEDFSFNEFGELASRYNSVHRIYLLLLKVLKACTSDFTLCKRVGIPPGRLLSYYRFNMAIMRLGHALRTIAEVFPTLPDDRRKIVVEFISKLDSTYLLVMKAFYGGNEDAAYRLSGSRDEFVELVRGTFVGDLGVVGERLIWVSYELHEMIHRIYS